MVEPRTKGSVWLLATVMSGTEMMLVGSLAVLFAVLVSPPPLTVAWFTTELAALRSTVTVMVIGGYEEPAASASARVQVTV